MHLLPSFRARFPGRCMDPVKHTPLPMPPMSEGSPPFVVTDNLCLSTGSGVHLPTTTRRGFSLRAPALAHRKSLAVGEWTRGFNFYVGVDFIPFLTSFRSSSSVSIACSSASVLSVFVLLLSRAVLSAIFLSGGDLNARLTTLTYVTSGADTSHVISLNP